VTVGRRARDILGRDFKKDIVKSFTDMIGRNRVEYAKAGQISGYVLEAFGAESFDICTLISNEFRSVLVQKPTRSQLIPLTLPKTTGISDDSANANPYEFEPDEVTLLNALLPRNIGVQIFRALLDSAAGEQAARMTAMDNATRNAGDMIKRVSLQYNRARQAYITKELIEIISGAEAI
jgi:F-type H+-transporting ATPase subunit gamma